MKFLRDDQIRKMRAERAEVDRKFEIAAAKRKRWLASPEGQRQQAKMEKEQARHLAQRAQREAAMTDFERDLVAALEAIGRIRYRYYDWESAAFAAFLKKRSRSIGSLTIRRLVKLHQEFITSDQYRRDAENMNLAAAMQCAHGPN